MSSRPIASLFTGGKPPVRPSPDLARILALPKRPPVEPNTARAQAMIDHVVAKYGRGPRACRCRRIQDDAHVIPKPCIKEPNYAQAWAMHEMATVGGLVGQLGVGSGKTFLDILAAMAFQNCQCAVLLVPSTLVDQLALEYDLVAEHFRVPTMQFHAGLKAPKGRIVPGAPVVHVMPYSRFQLAEATVFLDTLKPDLLIVDEAQNLASMTSTRSGRYLRFAAAHPNCRFAIWSGTLTNDEIQDYAHHCDFALGDGSPLPRDPDVVDEWGSAINPEDFNAPPGALLALANQDEHIQDAFHRRLVWTPGFVATRGASIDAEMEILERPPPHMPVVVRDHLAQLRALWLRPDGEELVDALAVARCARELACGLYLRWRFNNGETDSQIDEWLAARKAWRRELRQKLARREPHLDSPLLCANAAARAWGSQGSVLDYDDDGTPIEATAVNPTAPMWKAETWPRWAAVRGTVKPLTESVRVDPFLANDAVAWGMQERGIIWYQTVAFGAWVAELSNGVFPLHGGGPDAGKRIAKERGDRTIVASIASHGTGRDGLQRLFKTQIVTQPPASAVGWEQLLGRLSRIGQEAQVITAWLYRHTPEVRAATDDALRRALYVQRTMGSVQKLHAGWKVAA